MEAFYQKSYQDKKENPCKLLLYKGFALYWVPGTGVEPAHPYEYCTLNTARLPIPPSGPYVVTLSRRGRDSNPR